ncbi:MAG: polyribonucleotide nucleotidyltransferase [Candidatus Uhrbacteria bacterium]
MADQTSSAIRHFETEWGGRTLSFDVNRYAEQANGSVLVRYGDTVILATVVMAAPRPGLDFFPLMVEFEEKLYAAGKIKGSRFIKREGRPSDEAILSCRLIDRCIRPLFMDGMRNDVQVVITTLSWDEENDSDILGIIGASAALSVSDIPWDGPIAGIRVGRAVSEDGAQQDFIINPTYVEREKSPLDLVVAGTDERVLMVESAAKEVPEETFKEAMRFALKHIAPAVALIAEMQRACAKEKTVIAVPEIAPDIAAARAEMRTFLVDTIRGLVKEREWKMKSERKALVERVTEAHGQWLTDRGIADEERGAYSIDAKGLISEVLVGLVLDEDRRLDGRALTAIRPLTSEVSLLPRTHGSGYFCRGETRVLSVVTLGPPGAEQIIDTMEFDVKKRYMHHYNFPPYSVGESKPMRGPGRRDIGHGALAERALEPVIPSKEAFPYTIRVVSEVMSSNGSSSMGSTCGSTIALMDAGVPISAPVAGIAMGIATDDRGRWKVLTDLQALEDGNGGMDFKIAGTARGITAVQMDTKTKGLTIEQCDKTFDQAHDGRLEILRVIEASIPTPRAELSQYAPRVESVQINPDKIREVIGPGGKIINEIIAKTGCEIDIEQTGIIFITSRDADGMERAKTWIRDLTREVEAGEVFRGPVTRLLEFGAFVEVLPGREGLVHISELAPYHVNKVTDIVNIGDVIPVKVKEIDDMGRVNLSLRAAVEAGEEFTFPPAPEMPPGGFPPRSSGPSDRRGSGGPPRRGGFGGPRRGPGGPPRGGRPPQRY